jgi:RNA polymerase sigma-70 factor (ECF subfamily)
MRRVVVVWHRSLPSGSFPFPRPPTHKRVRSHRPPGVGGSARAYDDGRKPIREGPRDESRVKERQGQYGIRSDFESRNACGYDAEDMVRESDAQLAQRLLARDEKALREAIAKYGRVVYGIARRVLAEASLAEEVAQDTFLALWRRPGAFDPDRGSLQAFLVGVARNKAIDLVRREESLRRAKDALLSEAESQEGTVVDETGVEEREEVRAALAQLSPLQREAILLAYFGGRTYREVASELGIPEGTAKTRLRDGLIKLREVMGIPEGTQP